MVPSSFGWGSAVFAISATFAPSCAARSAIASPIPRLAPEMKSVFPSSEPGMAESLKCRGHEVVFTEQGGPEAEVGYSFTEQGGPEPEVGYSEGYSLSKVGQSQKSD